MIIAQLVIQIRYLGKGFLGKSNKRQVFLGYRLVKNIMGVTCMLLMLSCEREDPTVFPGEVVDLSTDSEIPGVTLLVSVYEKPPSFLTLPSII